MFIPNIEGSSLFTVTVIPLSRNSLMEGDPLKMG
jgi:hypothetical protein